ncbi:MAG: porin family protein [Saprospiraceae bacterium]
MKNLILLFIAIAFSTTLSAQLTGIGFRPILTLSNYSLSNDLDDNYDSNLRVGGGAAIFAEFNLGNRFTFQPEIAYIMRGGNMKSESNLFWEGPAFGYPVDHRIEEIRQYETLHYLDIPLMFEMNFGGGGLGAYIAAGPAFSFSISNGQGLEELTVSKPGSTEGGERATFTDRSEYEIEMGSGKNDDYKAGDFSLNLGAGLAVILEQGEIGLDVRYTHGFNNIDVTGIKNRGLQIGVSYTYYLGN